MNKEQIHDEQISPLMDKIIDICRKNGIDMLASFHLPTPSDPGLYCTTVLLDRDAPDSLKAAVDIIIGGHDVINPSSIVRRELN